jgi:hypothetical protein
MSHFEATQVDADDDDNLVDARATRVSVRVHQLHPPSPRVWTVGAGDSVLLSRAQVDLRSLSRDRHASLTLDATGRMLLLRDLHSSSGTFVAADVAGLARLTDLLAGSGGVSDEQLRQLQRIVGHRVAPDPFHVTLRNGDVFRLGSNALFRVVVAVAVAVDDRSPSPPLGTAHNELSSSPTIQQQEVAKRLRAQANGRAFDTARSQDSAVDDLPPIPCLEPTQHTQSSLPSIPRLTQTQKTNSSANRTLKPSDDMPPPPPPPPPLQRTRSTPPSLATVATQPGGGGGGDGDDSQRTESAEDELLASGVAVDNRVATLPLTHGPATLDAVDGLLEIDKEPVGSDDATEGAGEPAPANGAAADEDGDDWIETRSQQAHVGGADVVRDEKAPLRSPPNPRRPSALKDANKTPLNSHSLPQAALDDSDASEESQAPHNQKLPSSFSSPPSSPLMQLPPVLRAVPIESDVPVDAPPPLRKVEEEAQPTPAKRRKKAVEPEAAPVSRSGRQRRVPTRFQKSIGEESATVEEQQPSAHAEPVVVVVDDHPVDEAKPRKLLRKRSELMSSESVIVLPSEKAEQQVQVVQEVQEQQQAAQAPAKRGRRSAPADVATAVIEDVSEAVQEQPQPPAKRGRRSKALVLESSVTEPATAPTAAEEPVAAPTRGRRAAAVPSVPVQSPPLLHHDSSELSAAKRVREEPTPVERKDSDGTLSQRASSVLRKLASEAFDEPATRRRLPAVAPTPAPLERKGSDGTTSRSVRAVRPSTSFKSDEPEAEPEQAAADASDASAVAAADAVFVVTACDGAPQTLLDAVASRVGVRFTSDPERVLVTHVVTEVGFQRRTEKVLLAFATVNVRAVVTPAYLKACKKAGKLLPERDFALKLDSHTERRIGSLHDALVRAATLRARNVRVLEGLHFWMGGAMEELIFFARRVISCAHGVFHSGLPSKEREADQISIVIVDEKERKPMHWKPFAQLGHSVATWPWVCDAIFSSRVEFGGDNWVAGNE